MNNNQNGKLNFSYKHGKSTYQHYCLICGKKVCWKADRCLKCYHASRTRKQYFCVLCNKQITKGALSKKCKTCVNKEHWNNVNYATKMRKKLLQSILVTPNKKEKQLIKLLKGLLPNEYRFVGNGSVIIEKYNPDFINKKQNKIIELYGDYWHNRPEVKTRDNKKKTIFEKAGYDLLIVWEKELKNLDKLKQKILCFNKKETE